MRHTTVTLEHTGVELECCLHDEFVSTGIRKPRPAVVVVAGGAYLFRARREGDPVAARLMGLGYDAFILRYSTYFSETPTDYDHLPEPSGAPVYPAPVSELMEAVAYVRSNAEELCVDAARVFVMGFSAGSHVSLSLSERWEDAGLLAAAGLAPSDAALVRPTGVVLSYPMLHALRLEDEGDFLIEAKVWHRALFGTDAPTADQVDEVDLVAHVRPGMPPTFIWHCAPDPTCAATDSLELARRLLLAGNSCELHLYHQGAHGISLADETVSAAGENIDPHIATWMGLADQWMREVARDEPALG